MAEIIDAPVRIPVPGGKTIEENGAEYVVRGVGLVRNLVTAAGGGGTSVPSSSGKDC